jgi:hypothetical protein
VIPPYQSVSIAQRTINRMDNTPWNRLRPRRHAQVPTHHGDSKVPSTDQSVLKYPQAKISIVIFR